MEERKKIAIGVRRGFDYLEKIGIEHHDLKPENVLIKDGEAKIIDFGIIREYTRRKSYRKMGYCRTGSKYENSSYLSKFGAKLKFSKNLLEAGSAAFAGGEQLTGKGVWTNYNIFVFILCEWKTVWNLLFRPLENENEKEVIREILKVRKLLKF